MKYNINTVVIYPGRFQPFGPHHFKAYQWLCKRFGSESVFIATSNHISDESPLNFEEKKRVILKFGIDDQHICQVTNPYKAEELLQKFNSDKIAIIFAYGEKDFGRINFTKKDGSPSYLKPYYGHENLEPFSKCGYVIQIPSIRINDEEISGTILRQNLPNCSPNEFELVMGWYDEEIHRLFQQKFYPELLQKSIKLREMKNVKKYSKHITHPYEDETMTFEDLLYLAEDLFVYPGNIDACSIKFDGHNYQVTYKSGQILASRNKGTIIRPMSIGEISEKFKDRPDLEKSFVGAHQAISDKLLKLSKSYLDGIFHNGRTFLNFEILHPLARNIYDYGEQPILSLHSFITYDENANEVYRHNEIGKIFEGEETGFKIQITPLVSLIKNNEEHKYFQSLFNTIRVRSNLKLADSITKITEPFLKNLLKLSILSLGNSLIRQIKYKSLFDKSNIANIIEIILDSKNLGRTEEYNNAMKDLEFLGGLESINPIEGLVVTWKGRLLKFTGMFAALVPIFRIYNENRYKNKDLKNKR